MYSLDFNGMGKRAAACSAMAALLLASGSAMAAGFTPGNVVALRVGDGNTALSTNAAPIYLDEFTPTSPGTLVQTIDVTTATATEVCLVGTFASSNFEGVISLSQDKQYVIIGAYACAVGTPSIQATTADNVNRVMARVKLSDGTVDTSIKVTTSVVTGNVRGAASTNGTDFYLANYQQAAPNDSNLYYTNASMAGDVIPVMAPSTGTSHALRGVDIFNGQLYAMLGNLGTGNPNGLFAVATGVPNTASNPVTGVPGLSGVSPFQNFEQFAIESYSPGVSGGRAWIADQVASQALTKWDYDGTNWTKTTNFGRTTGFPAVVGAEGSNGLFTFGCALGQDSASNPVVFASVASANPNNSIRMMNRNDATTNQVVAQASTGSTTVATFRGLVVVPAAVSAVRDWDKHK